MCLLIVLAEMIDGYPLVVAANRDEFLSRPATALSVLHDRSPRILGGQDHVAGGTWLAVNEHGVVAGLTNRPKPGGRDLTKRSRGELPLALAGQRSAADGVVMLRDRYASAEFNPCWILVGDRHERFVVDMTRPDGMVVRALPPGLHVLENRPLGEPSAKVDRVRRLVGADLPSGADEGVGDADALPVALRHHLTAVLADHVIPVRDEQIEDSSGELSEVAAERPEVAACCVHAADYGTKSSAMVLVGDDPARPPEMWVADGPPCRTVFVDVTSRWVSSSSPSGC